MVRFTLVAGLILAAATTVQAQQSSDTALCSLYFDARADWLRSLDGNAATIQSMENYAYILAQSMPRDDGINRMVPQSSVPSRDDIVTIFMTGWAEQGGRLPLCMEDAKCIKCTAVLHALQ